MTGATFSPKILNSHPPPPPHHHHHHQHHTHLATLTLSCFFHLPTLKRSRFKTGGGLYIKYPVNISWFNYPQYTSTSRIFHSQCPVPLWNSLRYLLTEPQGDLVFHFYVLSIYQTDLNDLKPWHTVEMSDLQECRSLKTFIENVFLCRSKRKTDQ